MWSDVGVSAIAQLVVDWRVSVGGEGMSPSCRLEVRTASDHHKGRSSQCISYELSKGIENSECLDFEKVTREEPECLRH